MDGRGNTPEMGDNCSQVLQMFLRSKQATVSHDDAQDIAVYDTTDTFNLNMWQALLFDRLIQPRHCEKSALVVDDWIVDGAFIALLYTKNHTDIYSSQ